MKAMKKENVEHKSSIYFLVPFHAVWAFGRYRSQQIGKKLRLFFVKYLNLF